MEVKLEYDTASTNTIGRLMELQEKGITLEDRMDKPTDEKGKPIDKITIISGLTKYYDDGYETTLRDLYRTGIPRSSSGELGFDSVVTNLDMVLYSATHQKYYFFWRIDVKFTEQDGSIVGNFQ